MQPILYITRNLTPEPYLLAPQSHLNSEAYSTPKPGAQALLLLARLRKHSHAEYP